MITIESVSKSFDGGKTFAVNDLSMEVQDGETLVLLGSSGCGKTTTMKMLNRLTDPTRGLIELDGQDIRKRNPVQLVPILKQTMIDSSVREKNVSTTSCSVTRSRKRHGCRKTW